MIIFLNGSFGVGKSTTARWVRRLDRAARVVDPEHLGWVVQRVLGGGDYQDRASWRRGIAAQVRALRAVHRGRILVPMAFDRLEVLDEIAGRVARREPDVVRVCLRASLSTILERLEHRGFSTEAEREWTTRRARECVAAHDREPRFGIPIDTDERAPADVARAVLDALAWD